MAGFTEYNDQKESLISRIRKRNEREVNFEPERNKPGRNRISLLRSECRVPARVQTAIIIVERQGGLPNYV